MYSWGGRALHSKQDICLGFETSSWDVCVERRLPYHFVVIGPYDKYLVDTKVFKSENMRKL